MTKSKVLRRGFESLFLIARGAIQIVPSGIQTTIEFDAEVYDLLGEALIVNPWTFTPTQTGYYYLRACVNIANLAVGSLGELIILATGIGTIANVLKESDRLNEDIDMNCATIRYLTPANVVSATVEHNFGAVRNIGGNWMRTNLLGYRIK